MIDMKEEQVINACDLVREWLEQWQYSDSAKGLIKLCAGIYNHYSYKYSIPECIGHLSGQRRMVAITLINSIVTMHHEEHVHKLVSDLAMDGYYKGLVNVG